MTRREEQYQSIREVFNEKSNRLVQGVGVNDADYVVSPKIKGKQVICPFYRTWQSMLVRCYNTKYQTRQPTYIGCTVCDEWLIFSNFKKWMEKQDWEGKELDKDLLSEGNKVYSQDTCVFVDKMTNSFVTDRAAARGEWPIGVCFDEQDRKFQAQCKNPFTKKYEYLGYFTCPEQAHLAWRKRKHELACQLADLQIDERVAFVLRNKYTPDKDWTNK